ncbi:RHS repeat domain-containing protein, partial [Parachitinimonas caeni]|nr:hypothetical protein [Parachitinimonas caeni]
RYRYNAAGELIALDDNGQCSQFRYDPAGRLIERQLPATEVCPAQTHRFRYDAAGRLIEATTGRVSSGFRYDKAGQLLEETSRHALGFEHRLQHRYDRLGHRIATTLSDQREVGFLYYGHGHLHQLLLDQVPLLDFERDA